MPWLPVLHTPDQDLTFFADHFDTREVWIVGDDPAGFIAFREGWIAHLYVAPDQQRKGLGQALLGKALHDGEERRLWTFQKNARARRFYERHGFTPERFTDGSNNEEREPDMLYRKLS